MAVGNWSSPNVWSRQLEFEQNLVRHLQVPSSAFDSIEVGDGGDGGGLVVKNQYGVWPAGTEAPSTTATDQPWLRVPAGTAAGASVPASSRWMNTTQSSAPSPVEVLESYGGAITFSEARFGAPGLRIPQLGAMHAVLGYWTTNATTPATVVMPTGTGKTETMLALLVAGQPERLLVLVPSDALRDQIAAKFETMGVLQQHGIVARTALRPSVGKIKHSFRTVDAAREFALACNVIVATPNILEASDPDARAALLDECSHLFVDEAHHVAARTWTSVRNAFNNKRVVQFTATPFREDGQHLLGKTIYAFPLREAQRLNYFSTIDYTSVIDFEDVDGLVAEKAVARLRTDLTNGYDHVLMARVSSVSRAKEVLAKYQDLAPDLEPHVLNSRQAKRDQTAALAALQDRRSRIVVCVNMLGEGFDLPALKVAAIHDPQRSLAVTLQFVGRFARTSFGGSYGTASVFVARSELDVDAKLRALYAEDADWNLVLRNLSDNAVGEQVQVSDFEAGFTSSPEEVDLRTLLPKMSTVVYKAAQGTWEPTNLVDFFGEENLLTLPLGINPSAGVTWCVVEQRKEVRWSDIRTIEEITYELFVCYFDADRRLLYINNSANDGLFEDLAEALVGPDAVRFAGSTVYRVMADIQRLVPTNVGVLDARDQFRRFSMHVGSDVTASFTKAEAGTKTQTNISGGGYKDGEHVNISASIKGRIWTHATAHNLKEWCDWCDAVGTKLLDDTISIESVIGQFILPEPLTKRPTAVLLGLEWPWELHTLGPETVRLDFGSNVHPAVYTDLVPTDPSTTGSFRFDVRTDAWSVPYEADVDGHGRLRYRTPAGTEIMVKRGGRDIPLSTWFNANGLTLLLDKDRIIDGDLLYTPTWRQDPFDRDALQAVDWTGVDLRKESQTSAKHSDSVQFRALERLKAQDPRWDLIVDDDGKGEIADIVALRIDADGLTVQLIHCKYAHGGSPAARVDDVYEVCGQAQKSVAWRRSDLRPFFKTLEERARRKQQRTGVSPFEVGTPTKLYEIHEKSLVIPRRMEVVIVQPGLSVKKATASQLDVLSSTESYLRTTVNASLSVWCSA